MTDYTLDLVAHLKRQKAFSEKTFGPGMRTKGICDHIRKELEEIQAKPLDVREWVDVIILALDGAWRCGHTPEGIAKAIVAKQTKNEGRTWPDWRTADPEKAIEHDRSKDIAITLKCDLCGATYIGITEAIGSQCQSYTSRERCNGTAQPVGSGRG